MPQATIVIPIYQPHINKYEEISLKQCAKVLGKYPIIFVCPNSLDTTIYQSCISDAKIERFDDDYFNSIAGYNQLMLSLEFYKRFEKFKYILIYQLDAYVFRDELEYWCNQGYDYIGAPIPENIIHGLNKQHITDFAIELNPDSPLLNGGYSLRKINSFIDIIKENTNLIHEYLEKTWYEDVIVSILFSLSQKYMLPSVETALHFSFEGYPSQSFIKINKQMPMGCHGWFKTDSDVYDCMFWFKHIIPFFYYRLIIKRKIRKAIKSSAHALNSLISLGK